MKRLTGQTAIVTGSSSGIGQGIAVAMAREGANVCINYHRGEEGAQKTLQGVEEAGGQRIVVQADISEPVDVAPGFPPTRKSGGSSGRR